LKVFEGCREALFGKSGQFWQKEKKKKEK
jgi:hypothetical protein